MNAAPIFRLAHKYFILSFLFFCFAFISPQVQAQDGDFVDPSEKFSQEELAQMLAPIALYPDPLLSQVLMASTYPLEVIEADRWVRANPNLKDEVLDVALQDLDWDPSVKAICHFPEILVLMSERITETTTLGNAFLAQEDEVMGMIQELRARAHAQNNLSTTSEQKVIVERETIIIEPANPQVIYVPYYDPYTIYGPWWYADYPPYYWGPTGRRIGTGISYWPGFYFGFSFGSWSYFDWNRHYIHIDVHKRPRYVRYGLWLATPGRWNHAPSHRRGVAYRDGYTARKYGQSPSRTPIFRRDTRGFPDVQRRNSDWRDNNRIITDRARQERERVIRDQRDRLRVVPPDQARERAERNRQAPVKVESVKPERTRVETVKPERTRVEAVKPAPTRVEPVKPERARVESIKPDRARVEPVKSDQTRVESIKSKRTRIESVKTVPARVNPVPARVDSDRMGQQKHRDNIFNRIEDGRQERRSSERGRDSRQGKVDDSSGRRGSDQADLEEPRRNRR